MALENWFWGNFLKVKKTGESCLREILLNAKFRGNDFRGNEQESENPGETGKGKYGKRIPLNHF